MATRMLAWAYKELGESDRAARPMRDVLAVARARGDLHIQVHALESLAIDAAEEGRVDEAAGMLREAHELNCLLGDRYREAVIVCRFARVLAHAGRGEAAARVLATARCSTSRWGLVRWPGSRGKRRGSEPYPGATGRGRARRGPDVRPDAHGRRSSRACARRVGRRWATAATAIVTSGRAYRGVTCSLTCPRLVAKANRVLRTQSAPPSRRTWSGGTMHGGRLGGCPSSVVGPRRGGARRTLRVLARARTLFRGDPRWRWVGSLAEVGSDGQSVRLRRARVAADAAGLAVSRRRCSGSLFEFPRGG